MPTNPILAGLDGPSVVQEILSSFDHMNPFGPIPKPKPIPKPSPEKINKVLSEVYRFRTTIPDYGNALSKELENSFEGIYPFITQNALLGIEIEVENIPNLVPLETYWSTHEDGSLRNCGKEFVSGALNPQQCVVS